MTVAKSTSWREQIISAVIRGGPGYLLACLVLSGVAYELHLFASTTGAAVTRYVVTSQKNVETLADSMRELHDTRATMLSGIASVASAQADSVDALQDIQQSLESILVQAKAMDQVPGQREEELRLLREIEQGIRELRGQVGEDS